MKKLIIFTLLISVSQLSISQTTFNKNFCLFPNNPYTNSGSTGILSTGSDFIVNGGGFDTLCNNYQSLYFYIFDSIGSLKKTIKFTKDNLSFYFNISSIIQTHDNGYIYAGDMSSPFSTHILIKFNINMDTLWTKIIPHDTIWEAIRQIRETYDHNFIMVGDYLVSANKTNIFLIKTDSLGNEIWKKKYPTSEYTQGLRVLETPDKGYLICGYKYSFLLKTYNL